ncbi:MAG: PAS domain S-box protein, partial [Candidatus Competibacteraceae bacterium]|nr:PAS domain S-box protein [Candidatus Competibacteraceae bacterium]
MNFLPHGFCFFWQPLLLWLHVVSDLLIALAYYSIPLTLIWFVRRRRDLEFRGIFVMFATFIVACGTTHLLGVWTIWQPDYWASGLLKAITAAVSVSTAVVLWRIVPMALALPSPAQLRRSNQRLEQAVAEQHRARQALEESEARFRGAFDFAPIGMALVSLQGRWLQVNAALCEIVGYSERELLETDFQRLTHPEDLARDLNLMQEVLTGQQRSYQMEKRYFHRDGRTVWILLSVSLVRRGDGQPLYFVSQIQDITAQRRSAQALRQARDDLEVRVAERTRELTEAHRRKDDFLAMLGHELRNPLAPIRNALEILKLDAAGLNERQLWARDIIDRQSRQLTRLVDDLLDVARISRGRIELEKRPIDLEKTVEQAVESVQPLVSERRQHLEVSLCQPVPVLMADPDRLTQALVNLLNNAVRYTPEGGHIRLTVAVEGQEAVIRVSDDGIGIPAKLLPRVFEQFVQGDRALDRHQGGLGLGLALVRSISVLHGGRVEVHSDGPGLGSEFTLRLPLTTVP